MKSGLSDYKAHAVHNLPVVNDGVFVCFWFLLFYLFNFFYLLWHSMLSKVEGIRKFRGFLSETWTIKTFTAAEYVRNVPTKSNSDFLLIVLARNLRNFWGEAETLFFSQIGSINSASEWTHSRTRDMAEPAFKSLRLQNALCSLNPFDH